jgi:hypothetical protein
MYIIFTQIHAEGTEIQPNQNRHVLDVVFASLPENASPSTTIKDLGDTLFTIKVYCSTLLLLISNSCHSRRNAGMSSGP